MNWTTELPTQPGQYWAVHDGRVMCVYIVAVIIICLTVALIVAIAFGVDLSFIARIAEKWL